MPPGLFKLMSTPSMGPGFQPRLVHRVPTVPVRTLFPGASLVPVLSGMVRNLGRRRKT